jgi:WD40 repeat protein
MALPWSPAIWDPGSLTAVRTMSGRHGGFGFINDLAVSDDGRFIISCSVEANAIIWDATSGEKFAEYESAHDGLIIDVVRSVVFRPGTSYALSFGGGGELHTYDVGSGDHRVYEMPETAADMKFSPDGRFLACGLDAAGGPNVMVIDFEQGTSRFAQGHFFPVQAVAFFPDGKRFATSAYNGAFKIWDAETATAVDAFGPNTSLDLPRTTSMRGVVMGENFDDNGLEWSLRDDEDGYQSVQHGLYLVRYKDEESGSFMWNEAILDQDKDFVIKTSIAHISGADDEGFGLLWGLEDLDNYFSFNVTAGGHYRVNEETDGEWTDLVEWTEAPEIVSSNSAYVMTVEKRGGDMRFSCNDVLLHERPFESFFGDQVGVSIWGRQFIAVDWLLVTQD